MRQGSQQTRSQLARQVPSLDRYLPTVAALMLLRPCPHHSRDTNRYSERCPNHFPGAPGPADILLRFFARNCQVVLAGVVSCRRTGRTPSHPVAANLSAHLDVFENSKLSAGLRVLPLVLARHYSLLGHRRITDFRDQGSQSIFRQLPDSRQVSQLVVEAVIGSVEPVPRADRAMNSNWASDRVSKITLLQLVVLREDLDSLGCSGTLHRNFQLLGHTCDPQPALARQQRALAKDPEVSAAPAHLQRSLDFQ